MTPNARTSTWVNQKRYTTLVIVNKELLNMLYIPVELRYYSEYHFSLDEPERIYKIILAQFIVNIKEK